MKVSGEWLDHPGTQALMGALESGGYQALFVGGCVRNALLGVPVADIDIATAASPRNVALLADEYGFAVVPTGIDHGTLTVIVDHRAHEVTTFRKDVETDGRHAIVAFSHSVAEDAARRDFTMNALYADRTGAVIDPLGGLPDLLARRVRFVGVADDRIREDHLRALRFFRFHAHFGDPAGGIDPDALAAIAENIAGLGMLSRERVGAEMRKLLATPDPAPSVAAMAATGVLGALLPGASPQALAPLIHLEGDLPPRWLRRLAVLGGVDVAQALRLSRAEAADLARMRDELGRLTLPAALGHTLGAAIATDTVLARSAVMEQPLPPGWQADVVRGAAAFCPVSAADLMPALHGPALGAALAVLKTRWLNSDLTLTRDQLLA